MKILFLAVLSLSFLSTQNVFARGLTAANGCNITLSPRRIAQLVNYYVPNGSNGRGAAASVFALDENGEVSQTLYMQNANVTQPVASSQKILTAWVASKYVNFDQQIQFTKDDLDYDVEGGRAVYPGTNRQVNPGDVVSVAQLMNSLLTISSNGAAHAIARAVSNGSVRNFVALINQEVGLLLNDNDVHSYFQNPNGLTDTSSHYKFAASNHRQESTTSNMARFIGKMMGDYRFKYAMNYSGVEGVAQGQLIKPGSTKAAGKTIVARVPLAGCGNKGVSMAFFGDSSDNQFPRLYALINQLQNEINQSIR